MELRIAQSALDDLQAIQQHYIEQEVPHIGDEYVEAILAHAGRVVPEFGQEHIRELVHPPFRVVYLREAMQIVLIRVWRTMRTG